MLDELDRRMPWLTIPAAAIMRLDRRVILAVLALGIGGFALAEAWERVAYPDADVVAYIDERYRVAGERVYADPGQGPLQSAAALERAYPADDQRYVPVGVLLRYERHVVAVLPDGRGGSRLRVMDDVEAYRRLYRYVGRAWGPAYAGRLGVPTSAASVPRPDDERDVLGLLREAERAQDVCYGWRVEIRSGRAEGVTEGTPRGGEPEDCERYLVLGGWIDPLAGRLRRGVDGDYDLRWSWAPGNLVADPDIDAISITPVELLEGRTTEPSSVGRRAGKGLLDAIGALPLLAAENGVAPAVPIAAARAVPADARPQPADRTDAERLAEDSWVGIPPAFLRVGAAFLLVLLAVLVPVGVIRWLVRRLRG